jgi:Tol biopolymer transport system component
VSPKHTLAIASSVIVVGALAVVVVRHLREQAPPPPPTVRFSFAAPPGAELGSGDDPLDAAISPDEKQIVFVATSGGIVRLWKRALDSTRAEPIPHTEGARLPAWKQTGRVISFFTSTHLRQVSLESGDMRDLVDVSGAAGATWLQDGSLLFAVSRGPIRQLRAGATTDATTLRDGDRAHIFPAAAGAAGDFVYVAVRADGKRVVRLHTPSKDVDLADTAGHAQLIGDRLLYARDGALLSQRIDLETQAPTGRSTLVTADVGTADGRGFFAASTRVLVSAPAAARARQLTWFEDDRRVGTVGDPGDFWEVRLSPTDADAAVTFVEPLLRTLDIMVVPLARPGPIEQLTAAVAADSNPVWSPDGTRVAFRSMQDGVPNLYARRVHMPDAKDEPVLKSELDETPSDWRGSLLLFAAPMKGGGSDLWRFNPEEREVTGIATTGFNESDGRWSPDGEWVAYVSDESGRPDIYAQPYPDGDRVRVSFDGGTRPRWSRDGNALYFVRDDQIMRAELQDSDSAPFVAAVPVVAAPGLRDFDVAHRSNRVLVLLPVERHSEPAVSAVLDWQGITR